MKVQHIGIIPPTAATDAGDFAVSPELLAASFARFSRSDEGISSILSKIDPQNPDASIDSIFKFVDYGHRSIADMAPIALTFEGISIYLAYLVLHKSPTAGAQETSTRYSKFDAASFSGKDLGTADDLGPQVHAAMEAYEDACALWQHIADKEPHVMRLPEGAKPALIERMKRNYVFDRARYFLPACLTTNLAMVQSARAWVDLASYLRSHYLSEARDLGIHITIQLEKVTPRLAKHAEQKVSTIEGITSEFNRWVKVAQGRLGIIPTPAISNGFVEVERYKTDDEVYAAALKHHENRYAFIGEILMGLPVTFGWGAVPFADIRDLNRHRTGYKIEARIPVGFYCAKEQLDVVQDEGLRNAGTIILMRLEEVGRSCTLSCFTDLQNRCGTYMYYALLGTQFSYLHTTMADKFIYQAELRTQAGAHFHYASLMREVLQHWYMEFPATERYIHEGTAEPE